MVPSWTRRFLRDHIKDMAFRLNTECVSQESYRVFINSLRDATTSRVEIETIRVLRNPDALALLNEPRFIEVELTNDASQTITIAIDITNLYVVAYRVGDECWFLDDSDYPPNAGLGSSVFPDIPEGARRHTLRFSGRYEGSDHTLQSVAGSHRETIELGMAMLGEAIELLCKGDEVEDNERARSFIIIIQMVSEAVRFEYIEKRVIDSMPVYDGDQYYMMFQPDMHMLSLENNWSDLSEQIQRSQNNGGTFPRPLVLHDRAGQQYEVDTITFSIFSEVRVIKYDPESHPDDL
ncbi:hypothetical protein Tsubulata_037201 [Turnera subulata]|uniref:rRNA N-glycosylase n=1 Tax=Turnera subulata TaxID=218843 RepID=A0A9Q0FWP3_9ROSI|nr:hypothetical protein Tsubulata_037201 [Turnera subulata]